MPFINTMSPIDEKQYKETKEEKEFKGGESKIDWQVARELLRRGKSSGERVPYFSLQHNHRGACSLALRDSVRVAALSLSGNEKSTS
jgi:hypothetical protein